MTRKMIAALQVSLDGFTQASGRLILTYLT